jgi:hypothetical protein
MSTLLNHSVTQAKGSGYAVSYTAPSGDSGTSLRATLDEFRRALELRGPLTVDEGAWLVETLAKAILDAYA